MKAKEFFVTIISIIIKLALVVFFILYVVFCVLIAIKSEDATAHIDKIEHTGSSYTLNLSFEYNGTPYNASITTEKEYKEGDFVEISFNKDHPDKIMLFDSNSNSNFVPYIPYGVVAPFR